ncbi:MAG: hypothetical protein EOO77_25015 [Oxalobacteraceae bacterium]|nr:MAG: hypothetical protein EOO77_25015 [Oxalobacteraceae bacterium]
MLLKLSISDEQADKFFDMPSTPWYAPAGLNRTPRLAVGRVMTISGALYFRKEIALWCQEFLVERAEPHLDVGLQRYFILFKSEEDLMAFKFRWW